MNYARTLFLRPVAVAAVVFLGGCSLSNPYVKTPKPQDDPYHCGETCSVAQAQSYSRAVQDAYRERLGRYAVLRNNTGAAEIFLGAAALGMAAGKVHRDALIGAGLIGATSYGAATWFGNTDLEALFASAVDALTCADSAVDPLRLDESEKTDITEGLRTLQTETPRLALALAQLDVLVGELRKRDKATASPLQLRATTVSDRAHASLSKANTLYVGAAKLRRLNAIAGNALARTVDRIVAAVDVETRKEQPDLSAAFTIAQGLGGIAAKIVPGLDAVFQEAQQNALKEEKRQEGAAFVLGDQKRGSTLESLVEAAIRDVEARAADLSSGITRLDGVVSNVTAIDLGSAFSNCKLAAAAALVVKPESLSFPKGVHGASVFVTGGKTPYTARVVGEAPAGLSVVNPLPGDRTVEVKTTADTPVGSYVVSIFDATSDAVGLRVEVTAAAPANVDRNTTDNTNRQQGDGNGGDVTPITPDLNGTLTDLKQALPTLAFNAFQVSDVTLDAATKRYTVKTTPAIANDVDAARRLKAVQDAKLHGTTVSERLAALGATLVIAP